MSVQSIRPSSFLAPYIKQYWGVENCLQEGASHVQRIVPTGLIELSFYLGEKPFTTDERKNSVDSTVISGQCAGYYDIEVTGNFSIFSVTFQPQGAMMFFDLPLSELYDLQIPLRYLYKIETDEIETSLYEARTFREKAVLIERFLWRLLIARRSARRVGVIDDCISRINHAGGAIDIATLADHACLSRKQFERTFLGCIGISPKAFLRIVRFQHAIFRRQQMQDRSLTELAYDCNYYDQSHMINDFKTFSGKTPKHFFSGGQPFSDYFSN
jgi:AraC-like DNA-binding protein